jgi:hypothetical protein
VGKSRLVYEFKAPLSRGCRVLEAFSVSHGKAYAYLPLIDLLKGYFGIALEDDERQRREKITGKVLTLDRTLEDALLYLFSLLGIADETGSLAQMDPQIRRQRTLEAVKRVLVRETLDRPCVVIFEDLHWIDSETQAFLDLLSESAATARLLLLVDYRSGSILWVKKKPGSCWRPSWATSRPRNGNPSSSSCWRRPRATPSSWRSWFRPWPRKGCWPVNGATTAWSDRRASCTSPQRCRGCWRRASTACRRGRRTCSRRWR